MAKSAVARIAAQPALDEIANPLGQAVVAAYRNAGGGIGLLHGLLNLTASALMATAYVLRRRQDRAAGEVCTLAGVMISIFY